MLKLVSFLVLSTFFLGCKDSIIEEVTLVNSLVGQWKVESASLDGAQGEDWNQMLMTINIGKDSLLVDCLNQPVDKKMIWPNTSRWFYTPVVKASIGDFVRNDSISLRVYLSENKLHINFHPPREWSYKETCPNNNSSLICSEQGQWEFVLTKK